MDIIKRLIDIDLLYIKEFSKEIKLSMGIEYYDEKLKDKYFHNFLLLNSNYTLDDVNQYKEYRKNNGFEFANFYIKDKLKFQIDNTEDTLLYYYFSKKDIVNDFKIKENTSIKVVDESNIFDLAKYMYLTDMIFGQDYAMRNALRYIDVLLNKDSRIKYYFLYLYDKPIGYVSALKDNDILKIEDFNIFDDFQRQGYGTTLFKFVVSLYDINYIYVVADGLDTPKNMYEKWGMKFIFESHLIRKMFN